MIVSRRTPPLQAHLGVSQIAPRGREDATQDASSWAVNAERRQADSSCDTTRHEDQLDPPASLTRIVGWWREREHDVRHDAANGWTITCGYARINGRRRCWTFAAAKAKEDQGHAEEVIVHGRLTGLRFSIS